MSTEQGKRIVVDPITRIEGHLRIEAETDDQGNITGAYSSGTMVRGLEIILQGRDPREAWAFAQRICGVCTLVHGIASIRSVEDALKYEIPANAQLIRNLMIGAQYIHDHVMHFYHLHALDWVDVVSALKADPKKTSELAQSISSYSQSSPGYFADVQKRVKDLVESGQLGIFANAYWGHPEYKLPPEANLMAVAHYLDALVWQREVVKLHATFGGKNPHPNLVVGGTPSPVVSNTVGLQLVRTIIEQMKSFVEQVYIPDTIAIASFYKDWFKRGSGGDHLLSYGEFPAGGKQAWDIDSLAVPRGAILNRDFSTIHEVDLHAQDQVQEFVAHAWYNYSTGKESGLHPYDGETEFNYTGPTPPYAYLDVEKDYSWLKSPRWKGKPMEVGPLARVAVMYASGDAMAKELVDSTLAKLELPVDALFSTLGRTAARALETQIFANMMSGWYDELLANIKKGEVATHNAEMWDPSTWPSEARGAGFMEAPRGALSHWMVIKNGKIDNYQAVVPSTWNAGPMDAEGQHGPYEVALMDNHQMVDPQQPLEILRTVHSFDPCLACAVHIMDPNGEEMIQVKAK